MKLDSLRPSFIVRQELCVIDAQGKDSQTFLHRLSTNHIENLGDDETCLTSFLDQKGRLVAIGYVSRISADHFRILLPYAPGSSLCEWLDQYLFAEDVTLADLSTQFGLVWFIGSELGHMTGPVFHFHGGTAPSTLTLVEKENLTKPDLHEIGENEFEALRIAGRVPFSAHEINTNFNPLQLGLSDTIHWAKGCYIGQEVVSRLESKEKASRTLLAGRVTQSDLAKIELGEAAHSDGGPIGIITSIAPIAIAEEANVLLVLKRPQSIAQAHSVLSNVRIDIMEQHD